ncbi:MAG: hypothetical protein OXH42_06725 [Acidimicrobiaceae bacterium]|nr:hypothetical protein [Acidimicrobiaceae bacterium]
MESPDIDGNEVTTGGGFQPPQVVAAPADDLTIGGKSARVSMAH